MDAAQATFVGTSLNLSRVGGPGAPATPVGMYCSNAFIYILCIVINYILIHVDCSETLNSRNAHSDSSNSHLFSENFTGYLHSRQVQNLIELREKRSENVEFFNCYILSFMPNNSDCPLQQQAGETSVAYSDYHHSRSDVFLPHHHVQCQGYSPGDIYTFNSQFKI